MEEDDLDFVNLKEKHSNRRKMKATRDKYRRERTKADFSISVTGDARSTFVPYKRDKKKIVYIQGDDND